MPAEGYAARQAAIFYSFEDRWDLDNHKQNVQWNTYGHLLKQYSGAESSIEAIVRRVDVITEDKDFGKYPFLIVPAAQLVDEKLVARWKAYAENGGNLVLTCRTGEKDLAGMPWEGPWAKPILDLIGAKISFYDTLPAPNVGNVNVAGMGATAFQWSSWGEVLAPDPGTATLANYNDQFYANSAAAVTRKLGKGTVTYIGVDSLNGDLEAALMRTVYQRGRGGAEVCGGILAVDWKRYGFWVATNFTDKGQTIPAAADAKILIGSRVIGPAGVAVWGE